MHRRQRLGQTRAQGPEKEAERLLRSFYTRSPAALATAQGRTGEKKAAALQQPFRAAAFFKRLPVFIRQTNADPFLKAPGSPRDDLKTLTVAEMPSKNKEPVA